MLEKSQEEKIFPAFGAGARNRRMF